MKFNFDKYQNYFFDCDGVILDSNKLKSDLFFSIALNFSNKENARKLFSFHISNGGISRFEKFEYFFKYLLKQDNYQQELTKALNLFSEKSMIQLKVCPYITGAIEFISAIPKNKKIFLVTGGSEVDVKEIFTDRNIDHLFTKILGSPRTKYEIIDSLDFNRNMKSIYWGDSKLDYEVSKKYHFDFTFVSQTTEFLNYLEYFENTNIMMIENFKDYV